MFSVLNHWGNANLSHYFTHLRMPIVKNHMGSSQMRDQTLISHVSCIGRQILYHWATREAPDLWVLTNSYCHVITTTRYRTVSLLPPHTHYYIIMYPAPPRNNQFVFYLYIFILFRMSYKWNQTVWSVLSLRLLPLSIRHWRAIVVLVYFSSLLLF